MGQKTFLKFILDSSEEKGGMRDVDTQKQDRRLLINCVILKSHFPSFYNWLSHL